jgi:hypothetical protein
MLARLFPYIWSAILIAIFMIGVASLMYGQSLLLAVIAMVGPAILFVIIEPWKDMR